MNHEFQPTTWKAFGEYVLVERSAAEVAASWGSAKTPSTWPNAACCRLWRCTHFLIHLSDMNTTPVSLLERIRKGPSEADWNRLVELYTPLLTFWARRLESQESDAADLVQDVFVILLRELPRFVYQPGQRFRGWLWTIMLNKWREKKRRSTGGPTFADESALEQLSEQDTTDALDQQEYNSYLANRALELMQSRFQPTTWKACWECVVQGRPTADVAKELGISPNAVRQAKSHVLRELRQELQGLLE